MPVTQNPKECGWFYHAPAKKDPEKARVDYPAPSNIPGIGFDDPALQQKEAVREMVFKETDSDYIRLAKMGGRKDLLTFNPDKYRNKSGSAVGYPRNEWFYLEDNRVEDEKRTTEENKQWQFRLPDYMVHRSYKPSFEDPTAVPIRTAAPYYTDTASVMKDEGRGATDKTVKIAENRRPGYGVRNEKTPQVTQKLPQRERAEKPQESNAFYGDKIKHRTPPVMPTEKEEPTSMSKLLAGEYERQWYAKLATVQKEQGLAEGKGVELVDDDLAQAFPGHRRNEKANAQASTFQRNRVEEEERGAFKLNKFKDIPSKLDSHQKPEIFAAAK